MKRKLKKCLRSQAGETIAEVLVALLVSALALTMLATMITSTVKMVDIGKTKMSQYYDDSKILELQNTPDTVEDPLTITIQSEDGYNDFCGAKTSWDAAEPYDSALETYYDSSFNFRTVLQLPFVEGTAKSKSATSSDFVATHYGDWPAPEEFVFN